MNKSMLLTLGFVVASAATAFASVPAFDLDKGETSLGFNVYDTNRSSNVDGNWGNGFKFNEFYTSVGIEKNLSVFVNYSKNNKTLPDPSSGVMTVLEAKYTDYGFQYSLSPNVGILAGYRNMNGSQVTTTDTATDKIHDYIYGFSVKYDFNNRYSTYGTYLKNNKIEDSVVGVTYNFDKKSYMDLSYKHLKVSTDSTTVIRGIGVGLGVKF